MDGRRDGTRRKLAGLYLPTLAISFGQGLILPAVPALAGRFDVSPGLAAQIVTAFAAGRVTALLPSGILVDRLSPGLVLLLGSACFVGGAVLMLLTPVFWGLLIGQWLAGVGSSLWLAGREISGLALVRPDQRGRLMSGFFGFQLAGTGLGPVAGGLIVDRSGVPAVLLANLLVAAAVAVETLVLRHSLSPAREPAGPAARPSGSVLASLREISRDNRAMFLILAFATFSMHVYRYSLNSLLPLHAGVALGFSSTQVGVLFGISSLWITLMIVPAGFILDRIGRKWAAVPAAVIPAVVFSVMPFAHTMLHLSVLMSVVGIATGLSLGSMSTFSYDVIPDRARGRLQALRRLVGEFGTLSGPLAGGLISDRSGPASAFFVYVPLLALTALLLAFGTRETLVRHRPVRMESPG